jgi:lipopolysaccharide/colanic/teichoic acid biosynthesis glycosyltransferase
MLDVVASVSLSLIMTPVLLTAYVLVRCTSKGPVIFAQDRVGKNGKEFTLYKFRTMVADAERHTGPVLAQESDARITSVGRLLRATRIDELPQLLNVLLGDMSLIGPRPEREFFVRKFLASVPGYATRFTVKPGITGLAQVAGGYATPVERKLSFDLLYIYDYSFWLDLRILLRTLLVVLHKEKAAGLKTVAETAMADEP